MSHHSPLRVLVLMPVRDDWVSAAELCRRIERTISPDVCRMEIILVDDGSEQRCNGHDFQMGLGVVRAIKVLRLRRNLGHQRAIAIGLAHVHRTTDCDTVIVMDADGEDTPEGVAQLLRAYCDSGGEKVIFAERGRRSESLAFRVSYQLYKLLHRSLTGIRVRVGNFSILPAPFLSTMVVMSELWNHYAAAVIRSKLPFSMIPIARGTRIAGTSKMNFVSLVAHGLSSMSVFGDIVGVRVLIGSLGGSFLAGLGVVFVLTIRIVTDRAVPTWASYATGTLAVVMIQLITIATIFTFFMLSNRTSLGFVPLRDYSLFVEETVDVYEHE
jgi:hypothetical protein